MADVVASEITEIKRTPLNHAQGKQLQVLELEINGHTWANGDEVQSSTITGIDSILGVLSVSYVSATVPLDSSPADEWEFKPGLRAQNQASGSNKPAGVTDDIITFTSALTDSLGYVYLVLLVMADA